MSVRTGNSSSTHRSKGYVERRVRAVGMRGLLGCVLVLGTVSCSEGDSLLFPPPSSLSAELLADSPELTGQAGQVLPAPVRVEVNDEYGNPIPDIEIRAEVAQGGGSIQSDRYTSNDEGVFFVSTWRMGERPGTNGLRFQAEGVDPLVVEVPSGPGPATHLRVLGDEPAPARVASTLTELPRLRLTDEFDNPIPGTTIRFSAPQGGTVASPEAVTDASGEVQVPDWTLGPRMGGQILSARSADSQITAVVRAEAEPGPMHEVVWLAEDGTRAEAGLLLPIDPVAKVQDAWQNGLEGIEVVFEITEGAGTIPATRVTTDEDGLAGLDGWIIDPLPGLNRLEARVAGLPSVSITAEGMDESWEPVGRYFTVSDLHITQASQRMDGSVPLIPGRPGLLRVFVESSEPSSPAPPAELILYDDGVEFARRRVEPRVGSVPTTLAADGTSLSWDLELEPDWVRPGLGVRLELDPEGEVGVVTRRFGSFPSEGAIHEFDHFQDLPLFHVRFMAMRDAETGTTADLTEANLDGFMDFTRRAMPVGRDSAYIGGTFTTNLYDEDGVVHTAALSSLLSHFISTRDSIGDHYLHGIFPGDGPLSFAGVAYLPSSISNTSRQVGMTYDRLPAASATVAHELGHNLSLPHAPCGNPSGPDPNYPYTNAQLGVAGWDRGAESPIQSPTGMRDLMSYCGPRWISDYNYQKVLDWRAEKPVFDSAPFASTVREGATERILVGGIISDMGVELHPVLRTDARPAPPLEPGPYRLIGTTEEGTILFDYTFAASLVTHAPDASERHFAFVLPISPLDRARLHTVEVRTPEAARLELDPDDYTGADPGPIAVQRSRVDELARGLDSPEALVRPAAPGAAREDRLEWNSEVFPMVTVWDLDTGAMVGMIRGGTLRTDLWDGQRVRFRFEDGLRSFDFRDGTLEPLR